MGRPRFQPTEEQRRMVKSMSGIGIRQEEIAQTLGLRSPKTLRKHFRKEIHRGALEALAQVANTCYKMASSGEHPQMTRFWLATRAHWRQEPATEPGAEQKAPFIVALEKGAQCD